MVARVFDGWYWGRFVLWYFTLCSAFSVAVCGLTIFLNLKRKMREGMYCSRI